MSLKKWILIGAVFLVLLAAAFLFIKPTPPPIKLPNPNGYDDLVKAGQMLSGDLPECYWSWSFWSRFEEPECYEETRAFLNFNSEALKLARLGLSRESRTPITYTRAYFSKHMSELASIRLAQILKAEGNVAEKENRLEDAIQSYLDVVQLREKMHGGVMIDTLVGVEVERIGLGSLRRLSDDQITIAQRRDLIAKLARTYANRESYNEIMTNEKKYVNAHGLKEQFAYFATFLSRRKSEQNFEREFKSGEARVGLLLVELGLRNFNEENGHPPKTLQELIPDYLPFLPQNHFVYIPPNTNGYAFGLYIKDSDGTPWDWNYVLISHQ